MADGCCFHPLNLPCHHPHFPSSMINLFLPSTINKNPSSKVDKKVYNYRKSGKNSVGGCGKSILTMGEKVSNFLKTSKKFHWKSTKKSIDDKKKGLLAIMEKAYR
jgi:hypothetical protein